MLHETVDIERWKATFPLARLRHEARERVRGWREERPWLYRNQAAVEEAVASLSPGGEIVTSPCHIAVIEQLRDESMAGGSEGPTIRFSADVFIFCRGEPEKREVTKIGGLPYWPARKSWPCTRAGNPLTFVQQFCFVDSRHITGRLPGDLLLVFADAERLWDEGEPGLHFEWILTDQGGPSLIGAGQAEFPQLVSAGDVPRTDWQLEPFYGAIHRTYDYPGPDDCFDRYPQPGQISVIEGTKIGGVPRWVQSPEDLPGRFLCASGSVQPVFEQAFPYLNQPEPILSFADLHGGGTLMWGDMGSLYLFIDHTGQCHPSIQFY
jgi:hypothetical protein